MQVYGTFKSSFLSFFVQIVTPRIFALVCFRLLPRKNEDGGDKLNQSLLDAVNASGNMFISHTVSSFSLLCPRSPQPVIVLSV